MKLYSFGLSHVNVDANKIMIASYMNNCNAMLAGPDEGYIHGETNKTEEFIKKFPLATTVAFESDQIYLTDCNAILLYITKTDVLSNPQVLEFMNIASTRLHMAMASLCYPALGLIRPDKNETSNAIQTLNKIFTFLESHIANKSFMCGNSPNLCDISIFCELVPLYEMYLDENWRNRFPAIFTWIDHCIQTIEFSKVFGQLNPCKKPAPFNNDLYNQLHPQTKKSEPKKREEVKSNQTKSTPVKAPPKAKKKCPFDDLPPSNFSIDSWIGNYIYKDIETEAVPMLWENFDPEGYSFWHFEFDSNPITSQGFMVANRVNGFFTRIEGLRKYAFGLFYIGVQDPEKSSVFDISGIWIFRGQQLGFNLDPDWSQDSEYYKFKKLDPSNSEDKQLINNYLLQKPDFRPFSLYRVLTYF